MRISRQRTPLQIKTDTKPVENVEEFNYLGSMITSDAGVQEKLRPGLPWQSSIQQGEDSLDQQIRLRAKEEISEVLNLEHSFVWCRNSGLFGN
jgi:hypothetical protein